MKRWTRDISRRITHLLHGSVMVSAAFGANVALAAPPSPPKPACKSRWSALVAKGEHQFRIGQDSDYAAYYAKLKRDGCVKPWTILVYMAADNDLAPYALLDLYEMGAGYASKKNAAGSSIRSDLVVELDWPGSDGLRRYHFFQSPKVYREDLKLDTFKTSLPETVVDSPLVETAPEPQPGSGISEEEKFRDFLRWGITRYPSEHYLVILWGHGQGWAPAKPKAFQAARSRYLEVSDLPLHGALGTPPPAPGGGKSSVFAGRKFGGLAFNDTTGGFIDIPGLKRALHDVSEELLGDRPIDVYASDACLMQMAEVATEMSSVARFVVGSTQVQSFLGLPYRRLMYVINDGSFDGVIKPGEAASGPKADEPLWMARAIPKIFGESFGAHGLQAAISKDAARTITMSSLSSAELESQLLPAAAELGGAMEAYLAEDPLRAMDIQFLIQNAPTFLGGAQDISAFATLVKMQLRAEQENTHQATEAALRLDRAADGIQDAVTRASIGWTFGSEYKKYGEMIAAAGFKAFSVWLPANDQDYHSRIRDFESSQFYAYRRVKSPGKPGYRPGPWESWLQALYGKP